jgi:hypothetical protein
MELGVVGAAICQVLSACIRPLNILTEYMCPGAVRLADGFGYLGLYLAFWYCARGLARLEGSSSVGVVAFPSPCAPWHVYGADVSVQSLSLRACMRSCPVSVSHQDMAVAVHRVVVL